MASARDYRRARRRESVAGEGEASDFGRAAIENMQQHALTTVHPDWLAVAEHVTVDREQAVADFITVRLSRCE